MKSSNTSYIASYLVNQVWRRPGAERRGLIAGASADLGRATGRGTVLHEHSGLMGTLEPREKVLLKGRKNDIGS
jgi:hypothetical protein